MDEDRPIAPGPARLRRAHAAGIRAPARWLTAGLVALAAAFGVQRLSEAGPAVALSLGSTDPAAPMRALSIGLWVGGSMLAAAVGAAFIARWLSGGLGPTDAAQRERLGTVGRVVSPTTIALATVVSLGAVVVLMRGVIAGSARAVAAPAGSMSALWGAWLEHGLLVIGVACCAAGVVEVLAFRSARHAALHQTVEQARREAREHQRAQP